MTALPYDPWSSMWLSCLHHFVQNFRNLLFLRIHSVVFTTVFVISLCNSTIMRELDPRSFTPALAPSVFSVYSPQVLTNHSALTWVEVAPTPLPTEISCGLLTAKLLASSFPH